MSRTLRRKWFGVLVPAVFCLAVPTVPGLAQSARPDTRQMTCNEARDLVRQRGSVVLTTGSSTFDRFVASGRYCAPQTAQVRVKFAPTRDNPQCPVGYRCYQNRGQR